MSAFLLTTKSIQNLAESIAYLLNNKDWLCSELKTDLKETYSLGFYDSKKIASILWDMNADAIRARYGEVEEIQEKPSFVDGNNLYNSNKMQFFKSLQCYTYQCCEGKVPERNLYKSLEKLENALAYDIISRMPAYDMAEWG